MTHTRTTTVWCDGDGCTEWVKYNAHRVKTAERLARGDGWACHGGGEDYCPDHNSKPSPGDE